MQGPPGTGKSQNITNIIAEALAADKKVRLISIPDEKELLALMDEIRNEKSA